MHNDIWHKSILILSTILISIFLYAKSGSASSIDSLHKIINEKTGVDRIATELDFALELIDKNRSEALRMASSALQSAKTADNKGLLIRSYYMLGRVYKEMENYDYSQAYLDSALAIAGSIGDNWNIGEIQYHIGVIKHRTGETLEALEALNSSVQSSRLSGNFKITGSSYSIMGTIFRMNGMYDRAIEYIIKSKLNYEKAHFIEGHAWAAYLLGRIYYDLKLPEKALIYFHESLEIYRKLSSADGEGRGLAICYEQIGLINLEAGNFDEARRYIDYTMDIYSSTDSKYGMSNVYMNLGKFEFYKGNYNQAEEYLKESLQIKKEINDRLSQPGIYEFLGLCLIERQQTEAGFKTIKQGLDMAIANNQKKIQSDIYARLTDAYLKINDLKNAVISQNKQIELQNLILSGAATIKTEQLQAIYEIDEKNSQIAELEKQNEINSLSLQQHRTTRNIMIAGILLVLLVTVAIFLFYEKLRLKNRELNETNAAKDKFFAIIAHDLRGPTSALAALLEHINSSFNEYSLKELKKVLQILYKSAENVSNLLENLLIWAQSQVGKIEYRPMELKLDDLVQTSIKGLVQTADNKEISINVENNDQIYVKADPDMVQTIVRNILSNAIKFTHRGGLVRIETVVARNNMALVKIIDNGVGMEKSKLKKLFDITSKHHTNGTEDEKSTGLGLILVKDFVEKNKGTLTVESEKDKGTTVSFTLPTARIA
jgi:signal transduction histidine kinase